MSTVYVLEPPTKGKVIVTTSYGPLDIELLPKEAPKAVRNLSSSASRVTITTPSSTTSSNNFLYREVTPPARAKVLWNPFDDIVPRVAPSKTLPSTLDGGRRDTKQKATKKLNLLSFGEEAEEEEKELAAVNTKIKSSHDVLNDPCLLKDENCDNNLNSANASIKRDVQLTVREALSTKREEQLKQSEAGFPKSLDHSDEDEASFDARMRQQILRMKFIKDFFPLSYLRVIQLEL